MPLAGPVAVFLQPVFPLGTFMFVLGDPAKAVEGKHVLGKSAGGFVRVAAANLLPPTDEMLVRAPLDMKEAVGLSAIAACGGVLHRGYECKKIIDAKENT